MKYSEKGFNAYSFESFVFSVLRQIAAKSKRELLIKAGYSGRDNHSNNQIQFDAYAPEGLNKINTPVVFEIKYTKDQNGAASSINAFVKRIMGAKLPYVVHHYRRAAQSRGGNDPTQPEKPGMTDFQPSSLTAAGPAPDASARLATTFTRTLLAHVD